VSFQPESAFQEMAHGDPGALEFLRAFYIWAHLQDDLIDRDKPVDIKLAVWSPVNMIHAVSSPFFQKHKDFLMPVILLSAIAFLASETRKSSPDILERITAQVLKSEYLNVFLAVCFCVGGWAHAAEMSAKFREYSFDDEPVVQGVDKGLDLTAKVG
jgi:hypothetical protein